MSVKSFIAEQTVNGHIGMTIAEIAAACSISSHGAVHDAIKAAGVTYNRARAGGGKPVTQGQESAPRTKRTKGCLPLVTQNWVQTQLLAAHIAAGGDPDEFEAPDVTPEVLFGLPAVRSDSSSWNQHLIKKVGGLGSEAGVALRQWADRPLTFAQADAEAAAAAKAAAVVIKPKCIATLRKAHEIALEFDTELAASIQELILKYILR